MPESVSLVRKALGQALKEASSAHPGLLIQRGWAAAVKTSAENDGESGKTEHIRRICAIPVDRLYVHAYERWCKATEDDQRFVNIEMTIEGRLLVGLAGGGALETGCAVSQTWGMPYLPGSSVKGVVRAFAEQALGKTSPAVREIFGTEPMEDDKLGLSGFVAFHDAWWVPGSAPAPEKNKPFAEEIVTPHHSGYYGSEGATPATDLDSPVPNAMIGVQGDFRFTLEGPPEWLRIAETLVKSALSDQGIGAKTRAGYGYFRIPKDSGLESTLSGFERARLSWNAGKQELIALRSDNEKSAPLKGDAAKAMLKKLPEEIRNGKKFKENKLEVDVQFKKTNNLVEIADLRLPVNG
jgi:CRISPR-associated protein Cmr6